MNIDTTFKLASAGKILIQIAALQCAERGLIGLDDDVEKHLAEFKGLEIISKNMDLEADQSPFLLTTVKNKITLRHLLTHSSGLAYDTLNPLLRAWRALRGESCKANTPVTNADYKTPLLFEPGEGWAYGPSIEYVSLLVTRLSGIPYHEFIKTNILEPLKMTSTTFDVTNEPDIAVRVLQMVSRQSDGSLKPTEAPFGGTTSSVSDYLKLLSSLIAPSPTLLSQESINLLFTPQLTPVALSVLKNSKGNYAACAGIPMDTPPSEVPINQSLAGWLATDTFWLSSFPKGTVTFSGMPNVIWCMNRDKGVAMIFATQVLPCDDEGAVETAMIFFREMWAKFG